MAPLRSSIFLESIPLEALIDLRLVEIGYMWKLCAPPLLVHKFTDGMNTAKLVIAIYVP